MIECGCKTCTAEDGRSPTCRFDGTCQKYNEFKQQYEELKQANKKQNEIAAYYARKAYIRAKYRKRCLVKW